VVSFVWDGETVLIYSQPGAPKVRNIAANPHVAFHLQCDEYGKRRLTLEGIASIDETASSDAAWAVYLAKHGEALRRWDLTPEETAREYSLPIRIRPTRIRVGRQAVRL
jgi:PPOX class probable F420-dependent enzyme